MPRQARIDLKDTVYHIVNRANAQIQIFNEQSDFELFEKTLYEAIDKYKMRVLAYSIMPNHIHLALYPIIDNQISKFMHWLTMTFTQRYHAQHRTTGTGHLFQGRYKSFPVTENSYYLQLMLYIKRNALKASLVEKAESWRWSSLWIRMYGDQSKKKLLSEWPIEMPPDYANIVNDIHEEIIK